VGGRAPAHSVATGKALLAFADKDTMNLLSKMDFECYTYKTIATLAAFLKEIKKIKKCGYALNLGEWRDGVNGLAVPVFDHTKHAVAAVGITLPPVTPSKKLIMRLVECSKAISIELSHKFDLSA
jgi:DNA-binding IclR family transcriptional regulator